MKVRVLQMPAFVRAGVPQLFNLRRNRFPADSGGRRFPSGENRSAFFDA
ncbi:hypothetical protein [Allomesorhizobium camelthorni]|uniref:Uncharacterized protein n=1 Tax=Allomesorhizobium camelthorni TaxID=475069 RepID=A0A6G4W8M2_9HYPH|nr:hypothetical protein [Mesorhizobium camelthorni]NGO50583.1 hypothetical protein [Mesorhizobium camelthorni]